jgi:hypothetical protein
MSDQSPEHSLTTSAPVIFPSKRTAVNTMKYESPEVVRIDVATVIIEGQQLKRGVVLENFPDLFLTAPAYEADE